MSTSRKVSRGEIYYVKNFPTVGSEQRSGRPAVIVSNNANNENSGVFEVCYLTLKDKPNLPTHVHIESGPCKGSTILCEQINSIAVDKLGDYMCRIPEEIEDELDEALSVSLELHSGSPKNVVTVIDELKSYKFECKKLMDRLRIAEEANETISRNLGDFKSKAEMYERMYNDLLDRLVNRG